MQKNKNKEHKERAPAKVMSDTEEFMFEGKIYTGAEVAQILSSRKALPSGKGKERRINFIKNVLNHIAEIGGNISKTDLNEYIKNLKTSAKEDTDAGRKLKSEIGRLGVTIAKLDTLGYIGRTKVKGFQYFYALKNVGLEFIGRTVEHGEVEEAAKIAEDIAQTL